MPNPSNIASGLLDRREAALQTVNDLHLSKATREAALAEVRAIEAELDLPEDERTPAYNGRTVEAQDDDLVLRVLSTTRTERGVLLDALRKAINLKGSVPSINKVRETLIATIEAL